MINDLKATTPEVKVSFAFDEPYIGPYGYQGEMVAVDRASVIIVGGRPARATGKGRNVKQDGTVGRKTAIAYGLQWKHLPEEVRKQVADLYQDKMSVTPPTLDEGD